MDRDIPFEEFAVCYYCGVLGAFDLMGDYFCADCLAKLFGPIDDEYIEEE